MIRAGNQMCIRDRGESDHENLIDASLVCVIEEPGEAAFDEGAGLARPSAGDDQNVALGSDGLFLFEGGRVQV